MKQIIKKDSIVRSIRSVFMSEKNLPSSKVTIGGIEMQEVRCNNSYQTTLATIVIK